MYKGYVSGGLSSFAPGVRARIHLLVLAVVGGLALSACDGGFLASMDGSSPTELAEAVTEYRVVPASRALINVPNALVVLERELDGALEQRITLPNTTSLQGENVILLRAQTAQTASRSRLVLDDVLRQFGGAPAPFGAISDGGLMAATDQYGDVTYTTRAPGGDVTCVLAFRRTQMGSRALPRGATALDIMLRNCISGQTERALAPIGQGAFGLAGPVF
ncbi:hypothetical protein [Roseinatronobacter alkalisoli]|uniref:YjbF family lipoprotein n=1 Tax=Roseinatronobacter alkalisoli TaxID=3028235 RepID=A0ABT5T3S9_9RHOB|nr:hypothetical protein [Roseinatronobacter sp. HJB301]MDD7969777.1 hypothetical protein [Roseinatronobacter sp. HJB301]